MNKAISTTNMVLPIYHKATYYPSTPNLRRFSILFYTRSCPRRDYVCTVNIDLRLNLLNVKNEGTNIITKLNFEVEKRTSKRRKTKYKGNTCNFHTKRHPMILRQLYKVSFQNTSHNMFEFFLKKLIILCPNSFSEMKFQKKKK